MLFNSQLTHLFNRASTEVQQEANEDIEGFFERSMRAYQYPQKYGHIAPGEEKIWLLDLLPLKDGKVEGKLHPVPLDYAETCYALSCV